jgi:glycosyltransferase involved in cell wall biosynthesis
MGRARGLFLPKGKYAGNPWSVLVLAPGDMPTTDYYLRGRLEEQFGEVLYIDTLRTSPEVAVLGKSPMIVIVRHAPLNWLRWLGQHQEKLAGVAFLMDDDIPAILRAHDLPPLYALKAAWRYARTRRLLGRLCSEVWVSTPELARRYPEASPKVWEPGYIVPDTSEKEPIAYFYHGTWSHRREMEWLAPIVRKVQESVPNGWFEIMGTDKVKKIFRGIPRVRIVHPMPWRDYLEYSGSVRYQVGLAPCFDTPFNRARSHSKIFDITRLGAAGIYSDVVPYSEKVVHEQTGLLCQNDPEVWGAAITRLLHNQDLRNELHRQAREWCKKGQMPTVR